MFEKMPLVQKIQYLSKRIIQACREDVVLPISFFAVIVIRMFLIMFNNFFVLRVADFVDQGKLENDNEAKQIIRNVHIMATCS